MPVGDGEFSGLAVFSLLGFVVVLAALGLASLRPWEADTVAPHLSVAAGGGAVGDAVAVTPEEPTQAVPDEAVGVARAVPAVETTPSSSGAPEYTLAVAESRPVGAVAPPPNPPAAGAEPPASGGPAPAPPATPPPGKGGDGNGAGNPGSAVVVEPQAGCEGDEYEVTIRFATGAAPSGETEVEVVIRRVGGDGSESELELEGKFEEVGALLDQVASEGDCVDVRVESPDEEGKEAEEELEPVLP